MLAVQVILKTCFLGHILGVEVLSLKFNQKVDKRAEVFFTAFWLLIKSPDKGLKGREGLLSYRN